MRYIGLDVAYRNVGVVILDHAGVCVSSQHLKCTATIDPDGFAWHRHAALQLLMPGDVVAIEGLSFGSIGKTHILAGAHAAWLEAAVYESSLVFVPVPMRVKLWAVGTTKASKPDMIAWARAELGDRAPKKLSEHEADALALAQIALTGYALLDGAPLDLPPHRRQLFHHPKQTGLLEVPGRSFYRGYHGKGHHYAHAGSA